MIVFVALLVCALAAEDAAMDGEQLVQNIETVVEQKASDSEGDLEAQSKDSQVEGTTHQTLDLTSKTGRALLTKVAYDASKCNICPTDWEYVTGVVNGVDVSGATLTLADGTACTWYCKCTKDCATGCGETQGHKHLVMAKVEGGSNTITTSNIAADESTFTSWLGGRMGNIVSIVNDMCNWDITGEATRKTIASTAKLGEGMGQEPCTATFIDNEGTQRPNNPSVKINDNTFVFGYKHGQWYKLVSVDSQGNNIENRYMSQSVLNPTNWQNANRGGDYSAANIQMCAGAATSLPTPPPTPNPTPLYAHGGGPSCPNHYHVNGVATADLKGCDDPNHQWNRDDLPPAREWCNYAADNDLTDISMTQSPRGQNYLMELQNAINDDQTGTNRYCASIQKGGVCNPPNGNQNGNPFDDMGCYHADNCGAPGLCRYKTTNNVITGWCTGNKCTNQAEFTYHMNDIPKWDCNDGMDCKTWPDVPETWYERPVTASCQWMHLCLREKDPNNNLKHHIGEISHYTMFLGRNNNPGSNSKLVWSAARSAGSGEAVSSTDARLHGARRRASTLGDGNGKGGGRGGHTSGSFSLMPSPTPPPTSCNAYCESLKMMVRLEPMVKKHLNKVRFNALGDLVGARL
jgi:hypothetical protein